MDFVDEVDLVAPTSRRVLHVLKEFAGIFHFGTRRRVNFDEVHEAALVNLATGRAFAARRGGNATIAVEALREDARHRGLANATGTREQESMVHTVVVEGMHQGTQHVLLADHLGKILGAPLTRQDEVTHGLGVLYRRRRPAPATPRHPVSPLPLLPSGPGGVHG